MLDRLKAALVLAEATSFHVAAKQLGISQPQLTRTIQALESDLGIVLFDRGPRGVSLTARGRAALQEARALLRAEADFKRSIGELQAASRRLVVGVGSYISHSWGGAAFTSLTAQTGVTLSVRELDWWKLGEAVMSGDVEVSVGELSEAERDPRLATETFRERLGIVVVRQGHPLAGRETVTVDDLARYPLAAPKFPSRMSHFLPTPSAMGSVSDDGRFYVPAIECSIPGSVIEVVASSDAVAMILPEFCRDQLKSKLFVALPFSPPWLVTRQGLIFRRDAPLSDLGARFRMAARIAERNHFRRMQGLAKV
jgi:DNA-binding transcriptional LysR family regulator